MESMINDIYSHLVVNVIENYKPEAHGSIYGAKNSDNHGLHTYNAFRNLFASISPSDQQFTILQKVSACTDYNFLFFDNITDYGSSKKCNRVMILATKELNEGQKEIAHYCLEQFRKDGVSVDIGLFDKGQIRPSSSDDFLNSLVAHKCKCKTFIKQ